MHATTPIPEVAPHTPPSATAGPYTRAWACWALAVATSFAALEIHALRSAPADGTLSAQLRRKRTVSAAAIAAFGAWATIHIGWQGEP